MDNQGHVYSVIEDHKQSRDPRRFQIYFTMNHDRTVLVSNLCIADYLKLYRDDDYAVSYCANFLYWDEPIHTLHRSIDGVHFTVVKVPNQQE